MQSTLDEALVELKNEYDRKVAEETAKHSPALAALDCEVDHLEKEVYKDLKAQTEAWEEDAQNNTSNLQKTKDDISVSLFVC